MFERLSYYYLKQRVLLIRVFLYCICIISKAGFLCGPAVCSPTFFESRDLSPGFISFSLHWTGTGPGTEGGVGEVLSQVYYLWGSGLDNCSVSYII